MKKKQFLEQLNEGFMALSIYTENADALGRYSLLWQVGKEQVLSKYRTLKTLCYQSTTPNEDNLYPTIEIMVERKKTKKQEVYRVVDVINY